jgi:hypothetical protein
MLQDVSLCSIQSKLASRPRFKQICTIWGLTGDRKKLVAQMQNPMAARGVWLQLSEAEQRCLSEVLSVSDCGKGVARERVHKKTKLSIEVFDAAIGALQERWFLLEEGEIPAPSPRFPRLVTSALSVPALFPYRECVTSLSETGRELFEEDRSAQSHVHLLRQLPEKPLQHLATLCHVPLFSSRFLYGYGTPLAPSDVQNRVVEALGQISVVFPLLRALGPQVQAFFFWLCTHNGRVTMAEAATYLADTGESFLPLMGTLEAHALAFDTLVPGGQRVIFVPQELFAAVAGEVRAYVEDAETHALLPLSEEPATREEGLPLVLYDLATVLGWVSQQTIEITKEDRILKRWATKIRPMLYGWSHKREDPEETYVQQLYWLARELNLLVASSTYEAEKPRYRPGPASSHFGQLTVEAQMQRFLQWWRTSEIWYDLSPDGVVVFPTNIRADNPRKRLLTTLEACQAGGWYRVEALWFALWNHAPLSLSPSVSLRQSREHWRQKGEGHRYTALLWTLYEAGVVSLGYQHADHPDAPAYFQLTALGALALSTADLATEEHQRTEHRLIVQPSFEVLCMQFDPTIIYQLLQFAQIKRIGPVSTFVLTQAALLRGLAAGNRLEEILTLLPTWTKADLPQNVAYSLRDWARNYKEAKLSQMFVIELTLAHQKAELYSALADLGVQVRKLAEGVFAVASANTTLFTLRKRLEKGGLVVRTEP